MEKIKGNVIHICFSQSAGGSLKHAVKKKKLFEGKKIIVFPDDISIGTIGNDINVDKRIEWCDGIDKEDGILNLENTEYLKEGYKKFYKQISKIKNSDLIYLWYGESGSDMCGMLYTMEFLKDKVEHIYCINVSEKIDESDSRVYIYRTVGEVSAEKLKYFLKIKRKVELKEYNDFINQWNSLKKDDSLLRIFNDGKMKSVKEDYFDIHILKFTPKEFRKSARTVGSAIGYSETRISDDYIFWRVQELVKLGMLEFKGKFGIMREMEIKITQKGLELMSTDLEAISYWRNVEIELQKERDIENEYKEQGRMEEKISMAKKLMDVLDIEIIAEKIGLTVAQVKNIEIDKTES
ncbi:hypothetical protein psyc5s11_06040 [Clostridium gelidum]|uniref:DUF1835 domain-containing protein n=1 Tax=Clostridium gelidum TaxID=704125 RepID=A0ABM7SY50_9CLOT|nr:DUF3658 domain-containing protein [Clostridium gelidum]BCZ44537.1 hypothetical protein psyc5s11_06040 [Clostridium gelidum]